MAFIRPSLLGLLLGGALAFGMPAFAQTPQTTPAASTPAKTTPAAATPLIDLNSASLADLQALKGIGDKRAADIVKKPSLQRQGRAGAKEDHSSGSLCRYQGQDHRQAEMTSPNPVGSVQF